MSVAGVDTRRRWPRTGLTTRAWLQLPPVLLPVTALWTVQDVDRDAVWRKLLGEPSWSGDRLLHVIDWAGRWWVEDGHHRLMAAVMRGEHHVHARVWPPMVEQFASPPIITSGGFHGS